MPTARPSGAALEKERPELVVLDVMLPEIDGIKLLRRMKADAALRDIPVIMATAKGAEYDKILGLDLGADDYLTKPFGVMELVSRVKAVLRRCRPRQAEVLRCGGLTVDEQEHSVTADGARVELTYKEFQLLRLFLAHPGTAFTRDQLMEQVWGMDFCGESRTSGHAHPHAAPEDRPLRRLYRDSAQRGLPMEGTAMSTMTKRIFRATLLVGVAVLIASLALVMGVLYSYFGRVQESQLRDELSLAAVGVEKNGTDYLRALQSHQYRITWVRADGTVVYDTQVDAETMENHAQRQEIQQALAAGEGESSRYSSTLLQKTVYYAQRLPDGTVLRLSAVRVTAGVLVLNMLQPILLVLAAALILSGVLAGRLARRITEPLNRLDLEHPLENDTYEELAPLLRRMEHQRRQIDRQMGELRQRSEEFDPRSPAA